MMDSFREFAAEMDEPAFGSTPVTGDAISSADERRMQVRAFNYWSSLLDGRDFPSIEDLEPASVADFARNSVLLDFTAGAANPTPAYIGAAVRRECDLDPDAESMDEVPANSLMSRLSGYYPQILEGRAPVGIETDFVNQRGRKTCYRGILMPFSSDGDTIDFVYGVFNWQDGEGEAYVPAVAGPAAAPAAKKTMALPPIELEPLGMDASEPEAMKFEPVAHEPQPLDLEEVASEPEPLDLDTVAEEPEPLELDMVAEEPEPLELEMIADEPEMEAAETPAEPEPAPQHLSWQDGPMADPEVLQAADEATLADWLTAARATAEDAKAADGRSRQALYRALGLAYDFACAAVESPQEYQALLDEQEIVVQARAPMTAVAKLVFGADYDKARLTEYAAALSYAARQGVGAGEFVPFIEGQPGGLKALVEAERRIRRPEGDSGDWREAVASRLRAVRARPLEALAGNGEFALVLVRRNADGEVSPVAAVADPTMLEKAMRRAAA